jgi:hypothetical protein
MEGAGDLEKRPPIAEAHSGKRTLKRTTALETSSPKMGAVGGQQHEIQSTRKEVWTPSKPEKVSTPALQ